MRDEQITVTECPGGPLLVRGATRITGADGEAVTPRRRTVALCRCEMSAIKPWCDGSHKLIPRAGSASS